MSAMMPAVHEVDVTPMDAERLVPLLRPDKAEQFRALAETGRVPGPAAA